MTDKLETEVAEISIRLYDDAYMAWFSAESECEHTLHAWFKAAGGKRPCAYLAYRAALDREEAAAHDLHRLWELSEPSRNVLDRHEESVRD